MRSFYATKANTFPYKAMGVFSHLNKIAFGMKHLGALNRKSALDLVSNEDLIPLTSEVGSLMENAWVTPCKDTQQELAEHMHTGTSLQTNGTLHEHNPFR